MAAVATTSAPSATQAKNGPSAAHETGSESRCPTEAARGSATAGPCRLTDRVRVITDMVASAVPDCALARKRSPGCALLQRVVSRQ